MPAYPAIRCAALATALTCPGAVARAQAPAPLGVVRGTVVDSLRGGPLGGAAVFFVILVYYLTGLV